LSDNPTLTDEQARYATELSYLDLEVLKSLERKAIPGSSFEGADQTPTIGELLNIDPNAREAEYPQQYFDDLAARAEHAGDMDISLDAPRINGLSNEVLGWQVVKTYNDNNPDGSGFYGTVIDTGEPGLVVTFRGSEAPSEYQNIQQDWIQSDAGLVAGITPQQKEVAHFLDELKAEGYFDTNESITFAGHSLGGNLAEFATIYAAAIGVSVKIDHTYSYDGPGFSQEFIDANRGLIEQASSDVTMDHFIQSAVGSLLQKLDGVHYSYVELKGEGLMQHGTENVKFDEDGSVFKHDEPTAGSNLLAKYITGPFTEGLDRLLGPVTSEVVVQSLVGIAALGKNSIDQLYRDGELTDLGKIVITTAAVGIAVTAIAAPGVLLAGAGIAAIAAADIVLSVLAFVAAVIVYETISDALEWVTRTVQKIAVQVIDAIADGIARAADWTVDQVIQFKDSVVTGVKSFFNGLQKLFQGGSPIAATPRIRLDTYNLHSYADQLGSIKSRLSGIESRLSALYFSEGLLDIIHLMIAQKLPSGGQITKVIEYLRDTATDFERVEQQLSGG